MPDNQLKRLGAAVRNARKNRGFTQDRLADISGISVRYIGRIERGEVNPSYEILGRLEKALGSSFDFFLDSNTEYEETMLRGIINLFRACSPHGKRIIAAAVQAISNEIMDIDLGE